MITALRSTLFLAALALLTPPFTLLLLLCFWLPHRTRLRLVQPWVYTAIWLIEHLLGIRSRVLGRENIPPRSVVVLAKHQSAWETIVLQAVFRDLVFVWKKEIIWLPFFGWALALTPMISIDRNAGKKALRQLLSVGKQRLDDGYSVAIFPEGTRVNPGDRHRYQPGGAFLAHAAAAPVIPVALNSGEVWGKNAFFKKSGTVTVSIGPAIDPAGRRVDEINQQAEAWIEAEMRHISPHLYAHENA
ncbi:lysophospholipid acyltransferase family protein [Denitratisoma oestradiolicum]|uniref:1-acyl-sn-glycerol-3-phosphate acyltransferase n=1 Tax=Denitratisoma oestradiolicum TaxID=311182 RepID=A0A6S6XX43_9PROT|nr:lysophospholipid acyltransferase family protein [Denitratisoma oestradiolicum]TWO80844.1 1-acyl-sn-glycerol-3-phosphate acyltransferase [Denitratisoma oestradiolicum]CAB1367409.1 1-acyl-sn-glycerol-3-phosphate acyltransferase [Denitratisoma oestradiolicum]